MVVVCLLFVCLFEGLSSHSSIAVLSDMLLSPFSGGIIVEQPGATEVVVVTSFFMLSSPRTTISFDDMSRLEGLFEGLISYSSVSFGLLENLLRLLLLLLMLLLLMLILLMLMFMLLLALFVVDISLLT